MRTLVLAGVLGVLVVGGAWAQPSAPPRPCDDERDQLRVLYGIVLQGRSNAELAVAELQVTMIRLEARVKALQDALAKSGTPGVPK